MSRRRVLAILNPAAGRGAAGRRRGEYETALRIACEGALADLQFVVTDAPGHARVLAAASDADRIVVLGGDGTLGEVAAVAADTRAEVAVIPAGTGNDVARHFGRIGEIELLAQTAITAAARPTDMASFRCAGEAGRFLNIGGCGFDAAVALRVNEGYRRLRGTFAYIAAVASTLRTFVPSRVRIVTETEEWHGTALLIAVANSSSYGGGMRVAPEADLTDGLLDVVVVGDTTKAEFVRAFPRVFRGTHLTHPKVNWRRARRVRIEADPPLPYMADGEVLGTTPVEAEVLPQALRFVPPCAILP